MQKIQSVITQLEIKLANAENINSAISKSSVGWHIEHSLITINLIIDAVKNSTPENYKWKFNAVRFFVFTFNHIPRGKGKAPKIVQPKDDFTVVSIRERLLITKEKINELERLSKNNYFKHPYLGDLNLKATEIFLVIHTKHHLAIINDIIKSVK